MAGEGERGTDQRGTAAGSRGTDNRSPDGPETIPMTRTSATTDAPPLEGRSQAAPKFPLIVKKIDIFRLAGSAVEPEGEVAEASKIWSQCGISFEVSFRKDYTEAETRSLLGAASQDQQKPLQALTVVVDPDRETPSMRNLRNEWSRNRHGAYAAFFAPKVLLVTSGAPSAADPGAKIVYIGKSDYWQGFVLAHELGHHLIDQGHAGLESPLMHPNRPGNEIVETECRAARGDARAQSEIMRRRENAR